MQITPTTAFTATRDDLHIIIDIQKDVQLRLTVHETMHLARTAFRAGKEALDAARVIVPKECEVVKFPQRAAAKA